jgi:hypothetical protein
LNADPLNNKYQVQPAVDKRLAAIYYETFREARLVGDVSTEAISAVIAERGL